MPVLTELPFDPRVINLSVERDAHRNPGLHLSTVIKDRLITAGIERKIKGRPLTPEEQHLLFQRGYLWERMVEEFCSTQEWVERQLEVSASKHFNAGQGELDQDGCLVRPGECLLDGIYMTPDAIDIKRLWVEEWKATAIRAKGFSIAERRPEWLWQAASYAAVFGMTTTVFRVWHVSDNCITSVRYDWTEEEIRSNWNDILIHKKYMEDRDARIKEAITDLPR